MTHHPNSITKIDPKGGVGGCLILSATATPAEIAAALWSMARTHQGRDGARLVVRMGGRVVYEAASKKGSWHAEGWGEIGGYAEAVVLYRTHNADSLALRYMAYGERPL